MAVFYMLKDYTKSGPDCLFCYDNLKDRVIDDYDSVVAILDDYPVTEGHHLIITKRHVGDYFNISKNERNDADNLMRKLRNKIKEKDASVTGFNIGVNIGGSAGQTIFHVHMHLIPRRDGDTPDPKGGVRGVIPGKRFY
jgi:diadenosine tetraphosphate (Ap4A) HIT family hydrolase